MKNFYPVSAWAAFRPNYQRIYIELILAIFILVCFCRVSAAQEFIQAPAVIHISSTVSDGQYSIAKIVSIARKNKIKVVVINDRDSMRWEYGLWPVRNIVKKTVEENSIFKYGIKRYLDEIERVQRQNPDIVVIPGTESAPFYYWEGSIFDKLKLNDWYKHILTVGLDSVKEYQNLPVIGNPAGLRTSFRPDKLWPILLVLGGIFWFKKNKVLFPGNGRGYFFSLLLIFFGAVFFVNNWPCYGMKFDQYHHDLGIMPYQNFIDYVKRQGGLTFWAHPETDSRRVVDGVAVETREHTYNLLADYDYTGFAIFYEGYQKVGYPGEIWDEVLEEYCWGKRKCAVWAIAGLSFDRSGNLSWYMKDLVNMLLLPRLGKEEAIEALRNGRVYVMRGVSSAEFRLTKFTAKDTLSGTDKTMGQEALAGDYPELEISGGFLSGQSQTVNIKLIRNGKVIKIFEVEAPFDISYKDIDAPKNRKNYYRIEATSEGLFLVANPIFVSFLKKSQER